MEHRIRRATLDDLPTLKELWSPIGFHITDLEKRLTEFQIAEDEDGKFLGAIGFQIVKGQGLLHHEAFADFSAVEAVRASFWQKLQVLAANHGVLRVWARENSPNWIPFGFQPATSDNLEMLPEFWDRSAPGWLTLQLKDEKAVAKLEKEMAVLLSAEKQRATRIVEGAKTFRIIVTVLGFLVAFAIFGAAAWLYLARQSAGPAGP